MGLTLSALARIKLGEMGVEEVFKTVAGYRTVVNYFLEKDVGKYSESHERPEQPKLQTAA
jgi:uncharacterized membrane protein